MIVGTVATNGFPMLPQTLMSLDKHCHKIIVRLDPNMTGFQKDQIRECVHAAVNSKAEVFNGVATWNRSRWRDELMAQAGRHKPEVVLNLDHDEVFDEDFDLDLVSFYESKAKMMRFGYSMMTIDNRAVPLYPRGPHFKAYRWAKGINFSPYRGFARANYSTDETPDILIAKSRILHYCFFTRQMEETKVLHK